MNAVRGSGEQRPQAAKSQWFRARRYGAGFGRLFVLLFVVLVAVAWWLSEAVSPPPEQALEARHVPQYYMQNFTLTVTTPEGLPDRWVSAEHMEHYADDDTTHLAEPEVVFVQPSLRWELEAGSGVITQESHIQLSDGVLVKRLADSRTDLEARSERLFFNLQSGYAETNTPVTLTSAAGVVHANAMHAYVAEDRLHLSEGVRGRYEP